MTDLVGLEFSEGGAVATLTLNRPEALNALSLALEGALHDAFRRLALAEELRAIVLTGAGRAFSVGVDLKELGVGAGMARAWHGPESLAARVRASPVPIIAAVNGFAVTGGLELALQADFIVASASARFADTHARVGLTPSWGLTQILPRLIGPARARRMSLTGEFIDAEVALRWGLATEVTAPEDLLSRAQALAADIAGTEPTAMRRIRQLMAAGEGRPLADGLALEAEMFDTHLAGVAPGMVEARRGAVQERGRRATGDET
ncbi:enoyl-CoA hydratase [Pikeienuella sp. HZG-20]|uniref:enoyl-CoA hydratase n=1 Tax=Paludibacillus litoralis TaxID=3133267 RepID=UPI0030EDFE77